REIDAQQIDTLRRELLSRIDDLAGKRMAPFPASEETLHLCRAVAAHLNPQLVAQVRAKLAQQS
ncbi:MAG: hypothetical protein M0037_14905, partial [Betaproteobacteria bacterium]|nr:hypothetical protein [Betaproteobacteria bacterium]